MDMIIFVRGRINTCFDPGVEITAELSDLAQQELKDLYPAVAPLLRITIFDIAAHILGAYDQKLYEYATEHMLQHGVQIATNSVIEKVDATNLYVKDHDPIPYGMLLWVAGNSSIPFVDGLDVKKSKQGLVRILTDSSLRVKKSDGIDDDDEMNGADASYYPNVFALGDAADIEGQSLPTTAEVAVQKAKYLVQQLNKGPEVSDIQAVSFSYSKGKLVTYIGRHDGIEEGLSVDEPWSGHKAWLAWRSGSVLWTRTWRNRVGIMVAVVMNALFGKDVMRL